MSVGQGFTIHKHYSASNQLVDLLKKRGRIIEDDTLAQTNFRRIGYYRFSALANIVARETGNFSTLCSSFMSMPFDFSA